jgi:hypothetical protein
VSEGEQNEYKILVGPLRPIEVYLDDHVTPAEEDEVEFVSPRVPGRMQRGVDER